MAKVPFALLRGSKPGSLTGEYGLLIALVGLAAIPALLFMGNQFGDTITQNAQATQASKLFSLLDVKPDTGAPDNPGDLPTPMPGVPVSTGPTTLANAKVQEAVDALKGYDSLTIGQNPDGTFKATLPDGTSVATNATSVEGVLSRLMALQLEALAEAATLPDGTAVSSELSTHLKRLANMGYALGDNQDAYVAGDTGKFDAIAAGLSDFNKEYTALVQHPSYGLAITAFVEKPSGVITNVAYRNFGFGYSTQITLNGKYYDFNSFNPKGYVFAGDTPLELSGLVTTKAAEEIETADEKI